MTDNDSNFTVEPTLEELFPTPETMRMFQQATAALEAGRLVRGWREGAELTQKQLAERLRLTQARISAIEKGRGRDGPTYGLMQRLAAACGVGWPTGVVVVSPEDDRGPIRKAAALRPFAAVRYE